MKFLVGTLPQHTVLFTPKDVSECSQQDVSVDAMIKWENDALSMADIILFWLPAPTHEHVETFPHLELGVWASSGKVIYGCESSGDPDDLNLQLKLSRIRAVLKKAKVEEQPTLTAAVETICKRLGKASQIRLKGERKVPLHVWNTGSFQEWYRNMKRVHNRLDDASFEWAFRVGPGGVFTLFWVMHVDVHVAAEQRNKSNEIVISRPDISVVLAYQKATRHLDTKVVLIKEFRSPARTDDCFVHELPGGSSFKPDKDIYQNAQEELQQETGCVVDKSRLRYHKSRQLGATVTAHHAHLFSVELTGPEMDRLQRDADAGKTLGNADETELTYVEVHPLAHLCQSKLVDWSTLGMIYSVLFAEQAKADVEIFGQVAKDEEVVVKPHRKRCVIS